MELSVVSCRLLEKLHQPLTIKYQLCSKDGLNNILTGIEPGEILDF